MAKPAILTVDDDPQVLDAVQRDLRARYAADYRVIAAPSGAAALEALTTLKQRGDLVALFLADQRMPEMTGTEFLLAAAPHFPGARKVLLTAYADTDAAIQAINEVGLDHYLLKPWSPPEDRLYPVVDELLSDWRANTEAPFDGIRVLGTTWSPSTHEAKDFLARNQIPYRFLDIERDPDAAAIVLAAGDGALPVVLFPDGSSLLQPDRRTLAGKVGLHTEASAAFYDLIVIGAGPAGLAAGVYGASEGLRTVLVEREATGGQAGTSSRIENYLGFPNGISGTDLARRAATQAQRLGAEIITAGEVVSVRVEDPVKVVRLSDGTELTARAVILATGMTTRVLDVPGYAEHLGAGVYYGAAVTEATTYRDQPVFVIGGANSAGQGAMMLSRFCSKVTVVVRSTLAEKMSQYLIDQIHRTPNIEVLESTKVRAVAGGRRVESITLERDGVVTEQPASGVFIFVGAVPHTDMVKGVVALNPQGFILTGPAVPREQWPLTRDPFLMETSVPGIFAAGDVRDDVVRRVASAVGQGSVCVSFVHQYLATV
ncbi:MAG: FAD-dependent oxidoreductase [Acidimicrobiia bacterium]|nr:FAD-dependent oxidoreductase [Acidimicrobiia bacterium]